MVGIVVGVEQAQNMSHAVCTAGATVVDLNDLCAYFKYPRASKRLV